MQDQMPSQEKSTPEETETQVPQTSWQYTSGQLSQENPETKASYRIVGEDKQQPEKTLYTWQASEFASNEKRFTWYIYLALLTIIASALIYVISRNLMSVAVLVVLAIVVGIYGNLKPRTLTYSITSTGIKIGDKYHPYSSFKSFSVLDDMSVPSIQLMPIKRLAIPISIYVAPTDINKVFESIGNSLPFEQHKRDFADKLSHKLRF